MSSPLHRPPATPALRPIAASPRLTSPVVFLMSIAIGLAVASNYYAQPLLNSIGAHFGLSITTAGSIVTVAQLSYVGGLIFVVPLGDMLERRRLIVLMTIISASGLAMTASATSIAVVMLGTSIAGCAAVVAQILIPFASTLASPHERGKVVGTLMSGLLLGILLARAVAGALADMENWRTVYWVAAALMLVISAALWFVLPRHESAGSFRYPSVLASVLRLYFDEPFFRARSLLGALLFASFGVFWTPLTFLLSAPPYSYSNTVIGLFGLAGAVGALAASRFGHLADRGLGNQSTMLGLGLLLLSWLPIAMGQRHLPALVLGVVLLDLAIQGVHVTNMSAIYRLNPEARSRLTAGMMTANFIGAAAGSVGSSWIFSKAGWLGVCAIGALLAALALLQATCVPSARIPRGSA